MREILDEIKKINIFNPIDWFNLLLRLRFLHFFFIGGFGVILNLTLTFVMTEFLFGRENYFYAYVIALIIHFLYNFIFHTLITFQTKKNHGKRFINYTIFNIILNVAQAFTVKISVDLIGTNYYLPTIIVIMIIYFIISFIFSKLWIFKEK